MSELWIDTEHLPYLDTNNLNEFCCSFCQKAIERLRKIDQGRMIKFFAMGSEMLVNYSTSLEEMLKQSHNVLVYGRAENGSLLIRKFDHHSRRENAL